MIGELIGGAVGIGSTIFGGLAASKAMKRVKGNLEDEQAKNEAWFNRRYNEDATQRADAQRVATMIRDDLMDRNRQIAGTQAVMGGTEESVAAAKAQGNEAYADAMAQIAASGASAKDRIDREYRQRDQSLVDALNNLEVNKANNIATAVKGAGAAGSNIAGMF